MLLVFFPLAFVSSSAGWPDGATFSLALIAMMPLAERLGFCTEAIADHTNDTLGGLMNATMGNAPELIIALFALKEGLLRVVQVSLVGSVLSNLLLVLGSGFLLGGVRHPQQRFNAATSHLNAGLLLLAMMCLVFPAVLSASGAEFVTGSSTLLLSRLVSVVMLLTYAAFLVFQLRTHAHLFESEVYEAEAVAAVIGSEPAAAAASGAGPASQGLAIAIPEAGAADVEAGRPYAASEGLSARTASPLPPPLQAAMSAGASSDGGVASRPPPSDGSAAAGALRRGGGARMSSEQRTTTASLSSRSLPIMATSSSPASGVDGAAAAVTRGLSGDSGLEQLESAVGLAAPASRSSGSRSSIVGAAASAVDHHGSPRRIKKLDGGALSRRNVLALDDAALVGAAPAADSAAHHGGGVIAPGVAAGSCVGSALEPMSSRPLVAPAHHHHAHGRRDDDGDSSSSPGSDAPRVRAGSDGSGSSSSKGEPPMGLMTAVTWLAIVAALIAALSETLVGSIQGAALASGLSEMFVSAILLPIAGNAAEHASAVIFAYKNRLDITIG